MAAAVAELLGEKLQSHCIPLVAELDTASAVLAIGSIIAYSMHSSELSQLSPQFEGKMAVGLYFSAHW